MSRIANKNKLDVLTEISVRTKDAQVSSRLLDCTDVSWLLNFTLVSFSNDRPEPTYRNVVVVAGNSTFKDYVLVT